MHVAQLIYTHDRDLTDPDALLDRYSTLTGWSDALVGAGVERVTVMVAFSRDAVVQRGQVNYHFVRTAPSWLRVLTHGRLHRVLVALGPDLLHVNGLSFPMETWRLRHLFPDTPILLQDHADRPPRYPVRRAFRRVGLRAATGFLFAAVPLAEPWLAAGLIGAGQPVFEVMESSTRFEPVGRDQARAMTGLPGRPALLWVGRLDPNKDPLTVLAGFERALPRIGDAHLTMLFHTAALRREVERRVAASRQLSGRVHLRGQVARERMAVFYSAADLFVLGSHHEGSGYALIEAMACGAVPVVTDIPSFRVITGAGAVGAVWPPGNAAALATALVRCTSADQRAASRQVRQRFASRLSWPVVGRQALGIYETVVSTFPAHPLDRQSHRPVGGRHAARRSSGESAPSGRSPSSWSAY